MLKEERQNFILNHVKKNGIIRVSDVTEVLDVTEMTIRRDLKELENKNKLKRIHGGAKYIDDLTERESSHQEKLHMNMEYKIIIAKKVSNLIKNNDTVFIGAGSTLELVSNYLDNKKCKIVTNSLFLFNKIYDKENIESILVGGRIRKVTGAFVGNFSDNIVESLHFKSAFIGVNGINYNNAYTYNEQEGELQKLALDNSVHKYLVADHTKIGKEDFYSFYNIDEIQAVISDDKISNDKLPILKEYTDII